MSKKIYLIKIQDFFVGKETEIFKSKFTKELKPIIDVHIAKTYQEALVIYNKKIANLIAKDLDGTVIEFFEGDRCSE